MDRYPGFGVILARLMNHRELDAASLSAVSGFPEAGLHRLLAGEPPLPSHLLGFSAAFGLHVADLYVIADVPVPEALAPQDPKAESGAVRLIEITMALPSDQRARVGRLVEEAPQESRQPSDPVRSYDQQEAGSGALLVNLCGNRNLHSLPATAKTLALLTDGRVYLASATINAIGSGRAPLTSQLIAGFAAILGIPAGVLAAIAGLESVESPLPQGSLAAELAGLLWNCRRLTVAQVKSVCDEAKLMLEGYVKP
jgi:hypothetical protein